MPVLSTPPAPSATVGGPGPQGPAGQSSYTFTTAPVSNYNGSAILTLTVQNTSWMAVGAPMFIPQVGSFSVQAITPPKYRCNRLRPISVRLPIISPAARWLPPVDFRV